MFTVHRESERRYFATEEKEEEILHSVTNKHNKTQSIIN